MPARDRAPLGAPIWIDLSSADTAKAIEFYGALFGWEAFVGPPEYGGYVTFSKDGARIAGMMQNPAGSGFPDGWGTFFAVSDTGATVAAVEDNGGRVIVEPMTVDVQGTMAVFLDSTGTMFSTWQPGDNSGFQLAREHGTPAWHELITRDYAAALGFYTTVFGWEVAVQGDTDDFRYSMNVVDGHEESGMMDGSRFLPEGVPASWAVYFGSDDVDATVALAVEHGGSVVDEPEDTPYGRLATLADPTGATFKLLGVRPDQG